MKKLIYLLICTTILSLALFQNARAFDVNLISEYSSLFDEAEYEDICTVLENNDLTKAEQNNIISAYKLYVTDSLDLKPDDTSYAWMIVNEDNQIIRVVQENSTWSVAGIATPENKDSVTDAILLDDIEKHIKAIEEKEKIISVQAFEYSAAHVNLVYFKTESTEYFVPYSSRPDFTGMENGKLYTREEVEKALRYENQNADENAGGFVTDNVAQTSERDDSIIPMIVSVLLIAVLFVSGMIILRKKFPGRFQKNHDKANVV